MPIEPTTARQLDHRLASEQSDHRLPSVAAGLVRGGELVWSGAVGTLSGRSDGEPATTDTQYRIGSITKTFVGVEVLRLRDEGRFELNDAVGRHLGETADTDFGAVTIAQLLSHTSGLQAETSGPWWERTPGGSWSDLLASRPTLRFRPGARFHYSNIGYAVLGELVGRFRGVPWDKAVRASLLEPLGMSRTSTRPVARSAPGWGVHPLADLLARDTLDEMCQPIAVNDNPAQAWTGAHGLGWQVWNLDGVRYAGHGGSMPGFLAGLRVNRVTGDGCVAFANATSGMALGNDLLDLLASTEPLPVTPWSADAGQASGLELVGDWYWGTTPYDLRLAADGHLVIGEPGANRGSRFRPTETGWVGLDGYHEGEPLVVVRGADGRPSHLDLGSFRFSRTPYDPAADIPGDIHPDRWH